MVRYVKTIDELVEVVDREFSYKNAVCPICKKRIGTVNIPNVELGLPELKFTQFKHPGIFCIEGHCVISLEDEKKPEEKACSTKGDRRIILESLGVKVYEVMRIIKPHLDIDESIPNSQLYWILMDKSKKVYTKGLSYDDALDLADKLQRLGASARIV